MTNILSEGGIVAHLSKEENNLVVALSEDKNIQCNTSIAKGDKGDTPIKGVDYYTEADKEEIRGIAQQEALKTVNVSVGNLHNDVEKLNSDIDTLKETDLELKVSFENELSELDENINKKIDHHLENHPQGFDGNYNSLTNKPIIPSKVSQLVNDKGYITLLDIDNSENHTHSNFETIEKITEQKVNEWDNKSNFSGNYNDLTNKPNIPSKTSQLTNDSNYLTSIPSEYITESKLDNKGYVTGIELNAKGYLTEIPSEYVTESELNNKGYLTSVPNTYALKSELHNHSNKSVIDGITSSKVNEWDNKSNFTGNYNDLTNKPTIPSIEGLATESYVIDAINKAQLEGGDVDIDLSAYALKNELPTKTSELTNDSNFLTSIPDEYITESELSNKGYLTAQSISGKADKTELHNHSNKSVLDSITSTKISQWDSKSNFSGNYNDLTNKPNIPSLDGYATEQFVKEEVEKAQLSGGEVDLSGYALKTELHNHSNKSILDGITSTKISQWDSKSNFSGSYNDLANKPTIPTKTSQLSNDSGFITTIPSEYVTESELSSKGYVTGTELNNKGYLTSIPSEYVTDSELNSKGYLTSVPNTYALKTDIPTIPASLPANGGNANTVGGYSIWVGTQTQYDAIATKSSTTIYMIKE